MFSRHPASDSSKLHQFVSFDFWVMFLFVFKTLLDCCTDLVGKRETVKSQIYRGDFALVIHIAE